MVTDEEERLQIAKECALKTIILDLSGELHIIYGSYLPIYMCMQSIFDASWDMMMMRMIFKIYHVCSCDHN